MKDCSIAPRERTRAAARAAAGGKNQGASWVLIDVVADYAEQLGVGV